MSNSRNLPHDYAHTHVTGESEFIDDRPALAGELFVEIVFSPHAHAQILQIDTRAARALPGVRGIFTGEDFTHNIWGTIFKDQPLLAVKEVSFAGEPILLIAADTRETAAAAKASIQIKYRLLEPCLSIDEAKARKSFIGSARTIARGDAPSVIASAPHQFADRIVIRGAEHFYLENQAAIAYPREDGQIEVHSSSQHPTEVQHVVAHSLGLTSKDVIAIVKRMGGGFGGKESQSAPIAAYAALVAQKLNRPARVVLNKDDDMIITGKRNPFENIYSVGFDDQGRILGLEADLFSDGGAYADLSTSIMERAMLHIDNAYFIPHLRVTGQVCRTNFHPHTAFRGFGGPKGVATIEYMIERIAARLAIDPLDVRQRNLYRPERGCDVTHYGQVVENNCLPTLISELEKSSDYRARRAVIHPTPTHRQQNAGDSGAMMGSNTVKDSSVLRGISLTPVKFGISFTTRFLNQANALVVIHRDGTLQVSTGATEMGQGVNARISTLVADEFGIGRDQIRMMATSTEKNANTSPTAASSGTDLNGAAAVLATRKIKARLSALALQLFDLPEARWAKNTAALGNEPEIRVPEIGTTSSDDANQGATWPSGIAEYEGVQFSEGWIFHRDRPKKRISFADLIYEAYHHRISLSDYAHYRYPQLSFNKLTGQGRAFLYFTQGAAVSEVSIDRATGEVKVERVDILMDLGRPIQEGLDIGQVTGGFVQGMGWVTTEKLHYSAAGMLQSHSPSTYKIPSIQDTPRIFNVKLFNNDANRENVRATKAAGEPPLLLAISVWTAIHDALNEATDHTDYPRLELPATSEQILRALYPERFKQWEKQ